MRFVIVKLDTLSKLNADPRVKLPFTQNELNVPPRMTATCTLCL